MNPKDIPSKPKYFGFEKAMKLLKKGYTVCYYDAIKGDVKKYKFFDSSFKRGGEGEKTWLLEDAGGDIQYCPHFLSLDAIFSKTWFKLPSMILKIKSPNECPYKARAKSPDNQKCGKNRLVDCGNCEVFPEDCPLNRWIR